jgi:hypothetical protein
VNSRAALQFVRRHGIVLESAHGPVVTFSDAVAGERVRGNWWGHRKGHEIFALTRAVRRAPDVLVCRLVDGKITYVHRRVWPALVRLAAEMKRDRLAEIREVHTALGKHVVHMRPFPDWVPVPVRRAAARLTDVEARARLEACRDTGKARARRTGRAVRAIV